MAFQLAEAYVELSQRGFGGVMGSIGRVRGAFGSLVGFVTGPVGVAMAGIGGAAAVGGMVSLAAQIEQTEVQFTTLLGSADAAKQTIADLQDFAASTPFQFGGLAESAKALLAFGTSNEQVLPTLQVLGDVAAATGNQVGELANIYGKVKARGALMTESLDQFNERAIPVGAKLAEMFGKTEAEIRDMASKGQISFGDLQSAMQQMTAEGGIAFGGMQDQSTTLGGLWSTLKDNITLALTEIGGAMVEGFDLKNVVANFTGFVQRIKNEWLPSIVAGFRWLGDNIVRPVFSAIGQMASIVFEFVSNFDLYWKLASLHIANFAWNSWERIKTFFQNSWTVGKWFVSNIGRIFVNLYNNAGRIFMDLGLQIQNIWQSVLDFFRTGRFEVDFSPIADAFAATIEGLPVPEIKKPNLDVFKNKFEQIDQEFAKRQKAREEAAKLREAEAARPQTEFAVDTGGSGASDVQSTSRTSSFQFVGLASFAEKIQQQVNVDRKDREKLDLAKRQAAAAEQLNAAASGQGLRVMLVGGVGPVAVPDHSFGGSAQG